MNSEHDRQWAEQLEAGAEDDELLALAARLRRAGEATRATPSLTFQRQLRRDLLNQHGASPAKSSGFWRWAGSATALGVLAVAVGLMWLSISSSGRPSFGGAASPGSTTTADPTASIATTDMEGPPIMPPPEASARLETSSYNAPNGLTPGTLVEFTGRWRIPANVAAGTNMMAFIQLRNEAGETVAQADGFLTIEDAAAFATPGDEDGGTPTAASDAWLFRLPLVLPDALPPGQYLLVTGLYGANGQRLPVFDLTVGEEIVIGPVTIGLAENIEPKVTILAVSPAAGAILTGTQPITFTVRLAYAAISPPALLEVKIAETVGENGRGVATAQVTLDSTTGEITVPVVLNPAQELNAPAKLGLWLQLRAAADAPPQLITWPEGYRWRYNP